MWRFSHRLGSRTYHSLSSKTLIDKSFRYFQLSANEGNDIGQFALGMCYLNGEGTEKDLSKAWNLIKESADKGNPKAGYFAGLVYCGIEKRLSGMVDTDLVNAKKYLMSSSRISREAQDLVRFIKHIPDLPK